MPPEKAPFLPGPTALPVPRLRALRPRRLPSILLIAIILSMVLFYALLSLAPCMTSGLCYHGYASRFSFDASETDHRGWMAELPDHVNLTSLSIPGTHDTMTYNLTHDEHLQCQNANLTTQLNAGVRYFDIRARLEDDELRIYHSDGFTGFNYTHVLLTMFAFLDENPTEAIIMRLKEEGNPIGNKNTITFEESFNNYIKTNPDTSKGAQRHLQLYDRVAPLPTLGDLRSKIFLLQNFKTDGDSPPYGLAWEGDQMVLEDYWIIPDVYHLADKWTAIRNALEDAATSPHDNTKLYLAHTSASVGVLPIEAAAGPLNRTVDGMNDMTGQWLQDFINVEGVSTTGVVIIDFPGKQLIDVILRWNNHLLDI